MVPLGDSYDSSTIEPLIGGLRRFAIAIDSPLDFLTIEPLIGGLRLALIEEPEKLKIRLLNPL